MVYFVYLTALSVPQNRHSATWNCSIFTICKVQERETRKEDNFMESLYSCGFHVNNCSKFDWFKLQQ
jgi:hypothetical protein